MGKARRRGRLGLRAMLGGVAVAAAIGAALLNWIPSAVRRWRVEALLGRQYQSLVDPGAAPSQSFWRLEETRRGDLAALASSPREVARRLLRMVADPGDPGGGLPLEWRPPAYLPGVWAAERLGEWVVAADDLELGREATAGLFDLAAGGTLLPEVETTALGVLLLELTPRLGLDADRRAEAMSRLRSLAEAPGSTGGRLGLWARVAAEAGGRDELLAILDLAPRNREVARAVATSSAFAECRWPGLIGPVLQIAGRSGEPGRFLEFAAFTATRAGRDALLGYAADESHPRPERRKAIHRLKRDAAGVAFLLEACDDPARRPTVVAFFGRDHAGLPGDPAPYDPRPTLAYAREAADPSDPRPELRRLLGDLCTMDDPWPRLLGDLEASSSGGTHAKDLLGAVAPRADLSGDLEGAGPPIAWRDWFAALERFPDRRDRLDADFRPATVPPDCVAVLSRLSRSPSSPHREAALRLLVGRTERDEEVGPLIEALAERARLDPNRLSARDAESRRALRRRFAVDFAWDMPAWRAWWEGGGTRGQ